MSNLSLFHQEVASLIGEVQLEREWMHTFSPKEFAGAKWLTHFPKIYRGLPRQYSRDDSSQCRIDSRFTHLAKLKQLSLDKGLYSLYAKGEDPSWMRLSIFTWVIADGLGDWVCAIETARILKAKWPNLQIALFFISERTLPTCDEFPCTTASTHEELVPALQNSDLILQIPTYYPQTDALMAKVAGPVWQHIGEYGFVQSSWFHPKSSNHCMGLHALEKGVFTYRAKGSRFDEIENQELLTWMSGATPQTHHFHLAYLATAIGGAIFLHSLLKMHERDEKDIDLCCPDLTWLEQFDLQQLRGVHSIELLTPVGQKKVVLGAEGKNLRILSPGTLSRSDMRKLFGLSGDWVAVRGDQSFSEAISSNKPFFYDGRNHAKYFMKDLLALAENRLREHRSATEAFRLMGQANLWNQVDESGDWVDETHFQQVEKKNWLDIARELGACLQNVDTAVGMKKLCQIVMKEHSVNSFLCNLVQRAACHIRHPAVKEMESKQVASYLQGAISLTQLTNHLTQVISHGFYRSDETNVSTNE